jgi:FHA domain
MAHLIVKSSGEHGRQVIELKPGANRFGRSESNDHLFNEPGISETHCEVFVDHDLVFVRDLGSTNGTYVDHKQVVEAALHVGQTLQIGPLEMVLENTVVRLSVPNLPTQDNPFEVVIEKLEDGYASCMNHGQRHAVWDCPKCTRVYCDECIHKLRRVGGRMLRLCPRCSTPCVLSEWAEKVKGKKKSFIGTLADKVKSSFKHTTQMFKRSAAAAEKPRRSRKH